MTSWIGVCIVIGLTRSGLEPTIYRAGGEHANHYTTDAREKRGLGHTKIITTTVNQDNVSEWDDMSIRGLLFQ
jgi:hypothetical protein